MKSRYTYCYILLAGLVPFALGGCSSGKQISVSPSDVVLMPDASRTVDLDVTLNVPRKAFSRRSRLIVVPQLLSGDKALVECTPVVLDAPVYRKKMKRREDLSGYQDPMGGKAQAIDRKRTYSIPYKETVSVPDSVAGGRIVAVLTEDGCGQCSAVDTLDMAAVSNPLTLLPMDMKLCMIEPEFVVRPKIMEGRGEARLQFHVNRYDIDMDLASNRREMETMLERLKDIATDTLATLNSVSIVGMASVDGSYALNDRLAKNRADAARKWLFLQFPFTKAQQSVFRVGAQPEGWEPVLAAMKADGHPDTLQVMRILEKYEGKSDDVAEMYIRRLSCWNDIRGKYLAKDRKVEYVYAYTLKSFTTDEEMLAMYETRPDAFNEDEFLRVSTLKETDAEKEEVYRTTLHYFPQSEVAVNNLAVLLMRKGEFEEAGRVLASRENGATPEETNTSAALRAYGADYAGALRMLEEHMPDFAEARYNRGVLTAYERRAGEAYELLRPFDETATAIVALALNRNEEAASVMGRVEDASPLAEYVRAMAAARLDDHDTCLGHLEKACVDSTFRRRAAVEADFVKYAADPQFRALIK